MRAIVTQLKDDGTRKKGLVAEWPEPEKPQGNLVKTKTLFSGVTNGTERNDLVRGNYARPDEDLPAGWGYQNVGEVVEVGPDVKELKVGDVVYSSADHMEYALFPEDWLLVKLPDNVDRKEAALFGMASVAMRTCRRTDIRLGEKVLVVGAGFIGQLACQIANAMGARVTICDILEDRLELARSIDAAEEVVNVSGDGWKENIADGEYNAVLDLAGVVGMETQLVNAAAYRGRVSFIAGRFEVKYEFNYGQGREITVMQNSHFDRDDLANLCRLVSRGIVKIGPFVKEVKPVADAEGFYEILRDDPAKTGGTVFEW